MVCNIYVNTFGRLYQDFKSVTRKKTRTFSSYHINGIQEVIVSVNKYRYDFVEINYEDSKFNKPKYKKI